MSLKKIILIAIFLVVGYTVLKITAAYQTMKHMDACGIELNLSNRMKAAKTVSEQRETMLELINCMNERMTFPGTLFFDKEESIASIKITPK